jgi:DNA (cytosine-5)-methyltransferase 1
MEDIRQIIERGIGPGTFNTRTFEPWNNFVERPSGLLVPTNTIKELPLAVDLFSGCGGFSLGAMRAGFKVVACMDNDCEAMHTYLFNLGSHSGVTMCFITKEDKQRWLKYTVKAAKNRVNNIKKDDHPEWIRMMEADIEGLTEGKWGGGHIHYHPDDNGCELAFFGNCRKLSGRTMLDIMNLQEGQIDCVFGGPPCQGYSISGKRDIYDERNSLVFEFARLIVELQPKTFCMENVPGILTMKTPEGLPVFDKFALILEKGGMGLAKGIKEMLMNTSGAGLGIKGAHESAKMSKKEAAGEDDEDTQSKLPGFEIE